MKLKRSDTQITGWFGLNTRHMLDDPLGINTAHVDTWITINNVFSSHGRSLVYITRSQSYITSCDPDLHA